MSRVFAVGALAVLIVVILSAGSLWMTLDPGPPEPTDAQWEAVGGRIAEAYRPGDAIRVHPFWLRESTAMLAPFGEREPLMDFSLPPDPMFAAKHARIWLVSAMGRTDAPAPPGARLVEETPLGDGLTVALYEVEDSPIAVDLLENLGDATVERWAPGQKDRRTCEWNGREHSCRGRPWENVSVMTKQVGGSPRRCAVLHPYPDRGTVAVTWEDVPLGAGLLVRTGFTLDAARNEKGSDATVALKVDGQERLTRVEPKNGWDWTASWVDTSDRQGERGSVSIEVSAAKEAFRDLCFDAYVLSRRPDYL